METFKERLEFLFGSDAGPTKISTMIGMKYAGFARVWYEGSVPKAETLIKIQEVTACDLNWLLTGKGAPYLDQDTPAPVSAPQVSDVLGHPVDIDEFVFIPRYNVKAAAGHGLANEDHPSTLRMAFRKYWIKNYLHADPKDLAVIGVEGDSMEGVLNDGDNILVNHAKNRPGNGLYVIRIGEHLVVKRTQLMPRGKLRLISANEAYEPFEIDLSDETNDIRIIGKVEWFGRQV